MLVYCSIALGCDMPILEALFWSMASDVRDLLHGMPELVNVP
jgi:hypothetical protein